MLSNGNCNSPFNTVMAITGIKERVMASALILNGKSKKKKRDIVPHFPDTELAWNEAGEALSADAREEVPDNGICNPLF